MNETAPADETARAEAAEAAEREKRRTLEATLSLLPQYDAVEFEAEKVEDDEYRLVAVLPTDLTHGYHSYERQELTRWSWDTPDEVLEYIEENDADLRLEAVDAMFTITRCSACGGDVPVLGTYVEFAPAGVPICGCCSADGSAGIVR